MLEWLGEANVAALIGLAGGVALGLAARVGRFCTLGAIEDTIYGSDGRRMRMWGIAIGVAVIGTHAAMLLGLFDATQSAYLDRVWNPLATIVGGLMFGYGMAISGNCGFGALARLGGGDIRSFVLVIVLGVSAYLAMSGPLAPLRLWLFPVETGAALPQGLGYLAQSSLGLSHEIAGLAIGAAILAVALSSKSMLADRQKIFWAGVVGLAIVSGWVGTYWVSTAGFDVHSVESHTFAAPIGETILYTMTASGSSLSFGVGSVVGVLLGAAIGSYQQGHFRWEACEDPRELGRQIGGAALMGPGAVLAMGCSVGQGISAFSILAFSAPVAFAAILLGAALGLRQLISGLGPIRG